MKLSLTKNGVTRYNYLWKPNYLKETLFKLKSQRGFSLVEVLIASALMGAVALGIAKLTKDQSKSAKTIESRFEVTAIVSEITQLLSNKESCKATLRGNNANNTPAGTIISIVERPAVPPDVVRFVANGANTGPIYGNGAFRITSLRLSTANDGTNLGINPGTNEGITNLYVTFFFGQDKTYSATTLSKKIRIQVKTFSAVDFRIDECVAVGGVMDDYVNVIGDEMTGNLVMLGNAEIDLQSDRRLKHDIKKIRSSLSKVRKLNPVTFKWNQNNEFSYGFIAQDVEVQYPLLISESKDGFKKISYFQFTPLIVRSIQELDEENKMLKKELRQLKADQEKLKLMIERLEEKK